MQVGQPYITCPAKDLTKPGFVVQSPRLIGYRRRPALKLSKKVAKGDCRMALALNYRKVFAVGLLTFLVVMVVPNPMSAATTVDWNDLTGDHYYATDGNWSSGAKPMVGETAAWIDTGGEVVFAADEQSAGAQLKNTVIWMMNGFDYQTGPVLVGLEGTDGALSVTGGSVHSSSFVLGTLPDGSGVSGDGTVALNNCDWTSGGLGVGIVDGGSLSLTNVSSLDTFLSSCVGRLAGSQGSISLSGGSSWTHHNNGQLLFGDAGASTVELSGSSTIETLSSGANIIMAAQGTSTSQLTASGLGSSVISADQLIVGDFGSADLSLFSGAQAGAFHLETAREELSTGNMTVDGTGSLAYAGGKIHLGGLGSSTVNVTGGGQMASGYDAGDWGDYGFVLGVSSGSSSDVTVSGTDSKLLAGGEFCVGYEGAAALTVASGGLVESGQYTDRDVRIAKMAGSQASVTVDGAGSQMNSSRDVYIGPEGSATVVISAGGQMTSGWRDDPSWEDSAIHIAGAPTGSADVTVTGEGSGLLAGGEMTLAQSGQVTLTVQSGGTVRTMRDDRDLTIAIDQSGIANVTVNGEGSELVATGEVYIADEGHATVVVSDGGRLVSGRLEAGWVNKQTVLGMSEYGAADVTVTGSDAALVSGGLLMLGENGSASLTVADGGLARANGAVVLGGQATGQAQVSVQGAGSTLSTPQQVIVGNMGQASLTVSDGGLVAAGMQDQDVWQPMGVKLGWLAGSTATAEVTGKDSRILAGQSVVVGAAGQASLTVSSGGAVQAGMAHDTNAMLVVGAPVDFTAGLTVRGAGSRAASYGNVELGTVGKVEILVEDGGGILAGFDKDGIWRQGTMRIASSTTTEASVTVSGADSMIASGGSMEIGLAGIATVNLTDGARMLAGQASDPSDECLLLAVNNAGKVDLTVSGQGSEIAAVGGVVLGREGLVDLGLYDGAKLTSTPNSNGNCGITSAENNSGETYIEIAGRGSEMSAAGKISLGGQGLTTALVSAGGRIAAEGAATDSDNRIELSAAGGSQSLVRLTDAGSEMCAYDIYIGGNSQSQGGIADVQVRNGAVLEAENNLKLWVGGSLSVDDAYVTAGSLVNESMLGLEIRRGTVHVTGDVTIGGGTVTLADGGVLQSRAFVNNHGIIQGNGTVIGDLSNHAEGTISVAGMDYLRLLAPSVGNQGRIQLIGGVMECSGALINYGTGKISGRGGLVIGDRLSNAGTVELSGDTDIYGYFINGDQEVLMPYGQVVVSAGASAGFYGRVIHNGEKFKVSPNANAAFFGLVSGEGSFTGGGGVWFEGGYSPGNSPSYVQMGVDITYGAESVNQMEIAGYSATGPGNTEYDVLEMVDGGLLVLDGTLNLTLLDGFEPVFGSTFEIYRYGCGDRTGEFDEVISSTWGDGMTFDIDYGDLCVSVSVVPEPTTIMLLLAGGSMAIWRRRR